MLWQILVQFIFRLTFGIALAMAITPARLVTSGFYRVHLWVLMGLNTFAALILYSSGEFFEEWSLVFAETIVMVLASYAGAVLWLYEAKTVGKFVLFGIALLAVAAAILATPWDASVTGLGLVLGVLDLLSGGLLLGVTMAAMFLGHWYLNTPGMELVPLKRLVLLMAAAVVARTLLCGIGVGLQANYVPEMSVSFWIFVVFRWLAGLLGVLMLAKLAWETLKVPNTQSATGILYAGVVLTFIGELSSQLLSVDTLYPV